MTGAALRELLGRSPVRVDFAAGAVTHLGRHARELGAARALLVTDQAIIAAGHTTAAQRALADSGIETVLFAEVEPNPTTATVQRGLEALQRAGGRVHLIIGLGGGSVMDCAKGVNLLLCAGGPAASFRGDPPLEALAARPPLLPMILAPTTAGTGSEAQSFALLSDAETHVKMACGDRRPPGTGGLRPAVAVLDPMLTLTQPPAVAAATGIDAISHAVETAGCRVRTKTSLAFSQAAWELLEPNFVRAVRSPQETSARGAMLLGAHLAGCAIENSMLGAAHACANPLTARYDVVHGVAVGVMLPHVVRFNAGEGENPYASLHRDPAALADKLAAFSAAARMPTRLRDFEVPRDPLPRLAEEAAAQWTAGFNPRPVDAAALLTIYERAW